MLSLYSFPDWLSEKAGADGARQETSVDESNDELDSLHTITINPKALTVVKRESSCYIFVFF